jgi:NAD(P)-dependent dehydrogenase (short-subunit alcohol dehydrogenase family)
MPDTHLVSLAPGLVETGMQDYIRDEVDSEEFPSVQKLKEARGTENMPKPRDAADRILDLLDDLRENHESGDFVDLRNL